MAMRWRRGRRVEALNPRRFGTVQSRYLHDVHDVVAREPASAKMHASLAGGVLAALVLSAVTSLLPADSVAWSVLAGATWIAVALGLRGLLLERARRRSGLARLSRGGYDRLPLLFAVTLLYCALVPLALLPGLTGRATVTISLLLLGLAGLLPLAWMTGNGPMRHAVAGVVNLALHPRPGRFGGGRSTGLAPANLSEGPLGVAEITDFTLPQLASFDACVQCGRCEEACPAFAAGLPLNPKKFVNDLSAVLRGPEPQDYVANGHPGRGDALPGCSDQPLVIDAQGRVGLHPDTIWSCTTCRACVEVCPMMIEHVDAMIDLRRGITLRDGALAVPAQTVLENLRETDTASGRGVAARYDWAADLDLPVLGPGERAEVLLWAGEGAFDLRIQRTLRSLVRVLRQAGITPAILGAEERDCGDQARRIGDEETFQALARANIATLSARDFDYVLTADPHAMHVLRNEYPALGGSFRVRHHTEVMEEILATGRLSVPAGDQAPSVTYHDPCYLGRYNGEYEAPRRLLDAIGARRTEMELSGPRARCCGGGGAAPLFDVTGERRIPDMRMAQAEATGASVLAVACPGCTAMLEGVTGAALQVRDLAELLDDALAAEARA